VWLQGDMQGPQMGCEVMQGLQGVCVCRGMCRDLSVDEWLPQVRLSVTFAWST
jgi:hypothetical protein